MISEVKNYGGRIDRIYYCTALTDSDINRKPGIGMFLQILRDYPDIDKAKCLMIGDSDSDIEAGQNAGVQKSLKIGTSEGKTLLDLVNLVLSY